MKFASGSLRLIQVARIGVGIDNDSKYRRSHLILAILNHCVIFSILIYGN